MPDVTNNPPQRRRVQKAPDLLNWGRPAWEFIISKPLNNFPPALVDLRRISCVIFAELCHAAPKGANCLISVGANPCDAGLSCIPTNVGRTTGICCPRWQGPRPAETHRGLVVRWKCADMAFGW